MQGPGSDFLDFDPESAGGDATGARRRPLRDDFTLEGDAWSFRLQGRPVRCICYEDGVAVQFSNGAASFLAVPRLHFCPECVRAGAYPFDEDGASCRSHGVGRLDYSLEEFERFEMIAQLRP